MVMTIRKRATVFVVVLFMLLGGLAIPRGTVGAVECGVPPGTFRVRVQTSLFETQHHDSATIRILPVNSLVSRRGTPNIIINSRLSVWDARRDAGWVLFSHLVSVPSDWC